MKKKHFFLLAATLSLFCATGFAQNNVAINEDGSAANPSAVLDVKSFTKGILIPRVSTAGRLLISPVNGLLVYDTTTSSFWYGGGAAVGWRNMQAPAAWGLSGNTGTALGDFIGTTDARPLSFRIRNVPSGLIDTTNTSFGYSSMPFIAAGSWSTAIGALALQNNQSQFNTAVGYGAMQFTIDGNTNAAFGSLALAANTHGHANTAIGHVSLTDNTTGNSNTGVGYFSLVTNTTGSNNTALGLSADVSQGNLVNATAIGFSAVVNASNKVRIGNSAVTVIEGQVPFTTPSDGRFKYQVKEDVKGLDFILQLRPVTYQFDVKRFDAQQKQGTGDKSAVATSTVMQAAYDEAAAIRRSGFIAQEVEKAANTSGYNFSGIIKPKNEQEHYSLSYESFVVPLVKGVQEQQQLINRQKQIISEQGEKLASLQQQVTELAKLVHSLQPAK